MAGGKRPKFHPSVRAAVGGWNKPGSGDGRGFGLGGGPGGCKARRRQLGGLFDGRVVRQALDDLGQIHLRVQAVALAVGHQRVEQRIVSAGLKAAEK